LGGISKDAPPLSTITPVTPKVGVDGAVFKQRELLLIRRRDSHQWALPGGAVEIGETPSEAVIREVVEETGIVMQADYVVGVF
ncbi:MAG: NUDIX domain-containing protein, partial [Sulfobacillus thermotolerans]|nr:NUDIX domain-containing protein [Sulfobacillus thermotolerans]